MTARCLQAAAMPLHKVPVRLWKQLRLREGLCARLPQHYLRSLEEARTPAPVHYRPHGAKFKISPKNGQRERVEDVPVPIHYPPESQLGLWGGEGWILGHRYVNNDKVGERARITGTSRALLLWALCWPPELPGEHNGRRPALGSLESGGDSYIRGACKGVKPRWGWGEVQQVQRPWGGRPDQM